MILVEMCQSYPKGSFSFAVNGQIRKNPTLNMKKTLLNTVN